MKKLFVSYELAVRLKEKGFNEPCFAIYDNGRFLLRYKSINSKLKRNVKMDKKINQPLVSVPTFQQVTDWLREKHDIHIHISRLYCYVDNKPRTFDGWCVYVDNGIEDSDLECNSMFIKTFYPTYNEALDKAIEEALKLI